MQSKRCALCAKNIAAIPKQLWSNPQLLVSARDEICGAWRHYPRFNGHAKQVTPSTDESTTSASVWLADVQIKRLWGSTKRCRFITNNLANNSNDSSWINRSCLSSMRNLQCPMMVVGQLCSMRSLTCLVQFFKDVRRQTNSLCSPQCCPSCLPTFQQGASESQLC